MENKITIVFLHGFLSDSSYSLLLVKSLKDLANIKVLDLPGHNGVPLEKIKDYSGFVSAVNDFVKKNVAGSYIVCGFSLGGVIALEYHNNFYADPNYLGCLVWASPVGGNLTLISTFFHFIFKHFIPPFLFEFIKSNKLAQRVLSVYGINIKFSRKRELLEIMEIIKSYKFKLSITEKKAVFVFHSQDSTVSGENRKYIPEDYQVNVINNPGHLPSKKCINDVCTIIKNNFMLK